jgi:hypothetical protein
MRPVITFGPEYTAKEAVEDLNINESTFRVTKARAYEALRVLILKRLDEVGAAVHGITDCLEVIAPRPQLPTDDDDEM